MFNIADYLQKYAEIGGSLAFQKKLITKALAEVCNLNSIEFEVKNGTLFVKEDPLIKSVIFMKKDKLIEYIQKQSSKNKISDIR